ncbi:MAG: VPLPA-CTERM-specific exosortase XrtD [Methylophilaceae bacterium]|nr:VPLPA-CTERM-specific exosortase XrtD [Methylophilaceae bacterium]
MISSFLKSNVKTIVFVLITVYLYFILNAAIAELIGRVNAEERYSHAPLVLLISIFLIWKSRYLIANTNIGAWRGVALVFFSSLILVVGELSAIWTIVQYAIVLLCFGLTWSMMGNQIKKIFIPFFLIFLVIPLPYMLDVMLSGKMQLVSSNFGVAIIRAMGMAVFQEGNVIDLGIYKLQVVEACSGLNYLYPLMTIGLLMAYMYKAPLYLRLIMFISTIPISIVMNSFRIAMVAVFVNYYGQGAAEGFLHYFEGWVIFLACIFLLLLEVKLINLLLRRKTSVMESFDIFDSEKSNKVVFSHGYIDKTPIIVAVIIILASTLSTLTLKNRTEEIPVRTPFASFPTQINGWNGYSYEFKNGENSVLHLSDYYLADFTQGKKSINVYIGYTDSQRAGFVPHSPKACIPGGGWEIVDSKLINIVIDPKTNFKVTRFIIAKGEAKQVVYYWFRQRGRDLSNEYSMKFALLYDAIEINRTDGALVRFSAMVNKSEPNTDQMLVDFIKSTYPVLPKFIPN